MNAWIKILIIVVIGAAVGAGAAFIGEMLGVEGVYLAGGVAGGVTGAIALALWRSKSSA